MKMVMFLEKALIDSVKIQKDKISQPGYLSGYIRELKEKHQALLLRSVTEPEFLLFSVNGSLLPLQDEFNQLQLF